MVCRWPNSLLRSDVALAQVCKSKPLICVSPATSGGVANKLNDLAAYRVIERIGCHALSRGRQMRSRWERGGAVAMRAVRRPGYLRRPIAFGEMRVRHDPVA